MKIEIAILIVAAVACAGLGSDQPTLYDQETKLFESMVNSAAGDEEKVAEEPVLVEELDTKDNEETELVQAPFYRTLFRGARARLSNYDRHPAKKKVVRIVRDFVSSPNGLNSAASLASYSNLKRIEEGKRQTRKLNGGYGRRSKYNADYSKDNEENIVNPSLRPGEMPRKNRMDEIVKGIQSDEAEAELKKRTSKLFGEYKEDVGQDGWGH